MPRKILIFLGLFLFCTTVAADEVQLREDHPEKYTVQKGDTLWGIAGRFLAQPWQWSDIWESNPQIENPHLIYPGDVVVLTFKDGKPTLGTAQADVSEGNRGVKLSPSIRETRHEDAIRTIPLDAVQQFLTRPRVVSENELGQAPYIVGSWDEGLAFGSGLRVYVRGLREANTNKFSIFRKGPAYRDPDTGAILGYEALHVGDGLVEKFGDPATVFIVKSSREVLKGDRLMPQLRDEIPEFIPHSPSSPVDGKIISMIEGVSQIGQHQVVVLNRGDNDGLEPGHVLAIYQDGKIIDDPIASDIADRDMREEYQRRERENPSAAGRFFESIANDIRDIDRAARDFVGTPIGGGGPKRVKLPEERAGELLVFRTFESVSYGLVMNFQRPIHILDNVRNP
ncbi:MAG: LysM domain-containing protein [Gammaproteobacteria bacterium]